MEFLSFRHAVLSCQSEGNNLYYSVLSIGIHRNFAENCYGTCYRKTLTIANFARRNFSSGEITNLMSIDAQRFIEIVPFLNTVWSGPFQFALAIYFLYDLIGLSALAGLAVFAILVPINIYGSKYGRKYQVEQMKAKDERILLMNEVLQGVKVLKLYAWEIAFMKKIKDCRDREIKCLKKSALLNALLFVTYTGAPLLGRLH